MCILSDDDDDDDDDSVCVWSFIYADSCSNMLEAVAF